MFVGKHDHALDDKGRLVLPSGFRSYFEVRGFVGQVDNCIGLWTAESFQEMSKRWEIERDSGRMSPDTFRMMFASARDVRLDSAGRISLPRELLNQFGFAFGFT